MGNSIDGAIILWYCIAYPFIIAYCTCHVYSVALSSTCRCICVVPSSQPPFDGDDDDQLFNNIMEKPVHYPRGLADTSKKIIQGVRIKEIGAQDFENLSMWCEYDGACLYDDLYHNIHTPILLTTLYPRSSWRSTHHVALAATPRRGRRTSKNTPSSRDSTGASSSEES